jgi:hypothetical protein
VPGYGIAVGKHTLHKEVRMDVYTKRQRIAKIAKHHREKPITLLHHYIDEEWLTVAYHLLPKDKATGVDQQSWQEYGENLGENIKSLLNRAKSGSYKAPPVRRAKIPKPGSKEKRKLGIPTTEDKVLQKAVLMVLEPIYELEFCEFSFGFRRGKSQHQGLEYLWKGAFSCLAPFFLPSLNSSSKSSNKKRRAGLKDRPGFDQTLGQNLIKTEELKRSSLRQRRRCLTTMANGTILLFDMGQYFMKGLYIMTSFTNPYVCGFLLISLVTGVAILEGNFVMRLFDPDNLDSLHFSFTMALFTTIDSGGNL